MTLHFAEVTDAIASLDVEGLRIKDADEIPAQVGVRDSMLIPMPNIISDFSMERESFGGGSTAAMTVTYTVNYRLCFQPVTTSRVMTLGVFSDLMVMVGLILDAVLVIDVFISDYDTVVDIVPITVANMGIVNDPADNAFYGCDLSFRVQEQIN